MSSLDQAVQTQLDNIQKKTGLSLEELSGLVKKSGLSKHAEIRDMLMEKLGLGYGDANALVHAILASDGARSAEGKSAETPFWMKFMRVQKPPSAPFTKS